MIQRRKLINSISIAASCAIAAMSWSPASAATVVSYEDYSLVSQYGMAAEANEYISATDLEGSTYLSLSRFDPALGTLLDVELYTSVRLGASLTAHCGSTFGCDSRGRIEVYHALHFGDASNSLGIDLGPRLRVQFALTQQCQDEGSIFDPLVACSATQQHSVLGEREFSFTGSDAAAFVGNDPFQFKNWFGQRNLVADVDHDGYPALPPHFFDSLAVAPEGEALTHIGFDIGSDAHFLTVSEKRVRVSYTYEPFAAVPEPATWAMMILGFGLIGGVVRGKGPAAAFA